MNCTTCREAISARLDGENTDTPPAVIDGHLAACLACRSWQAHAADLTRRVRVRSAVAVPDLVDAVLARVLPEPAEHPARRARPVDPVRAGLLLVAAARLAGAFPGLFVEGHTGRELASWEIALAAGLALAAWRPARSVALFPMLAVAMALVAATSVLDVAAGRTALLGEAHHLLDSVGLSMVWLTMRRHGLSTGRLALSRLR